MEKFYTKKSLKRNTSLSLMCFAVLVFTSIFNGYSQVVVDFTPREESYNIKGDFSMIGNTNLTPVNYSDLADNAFNMEYVDVDSDNTTFNSSSSILEFSTENGANPECSSIVFAGLYWTGRSAQDGPDKDLDGDGNPNTFSVTKNGVTKTFDKTKVLIKGPTSGYEQVTATEIQFPDDAYNNMYAAYADVTDFVSANGGIGEYTVADIATTEGTAQPYGYYGGWGLVVVYQNIDMKWRDVTVFDGYAYVESAGGEKFIDVNGFKAVQTGDINIKLGLMAGEGDVGFGGDKFSIIIPDGNDDKDVLSTLDDNSYQDLQHAGNTTNNFFNSSIYTHNGVSGNRTPELANNTGVDIAVFDIDNSDKSLIGNGQDYTRFKYNSTQDTYIIFNATFSVDAYIPEPQGLISVATLNGSEPSDVNNSLEPSEIADFLIEIKNAGTEGTNNTKITIPLPDSVDPDDLVVKTTTDSSVTNTTPYTIDTSIGTNGAIVWNIGTLPVPPDPDDVLATISFSLSVTTDCTFYSDDEEQTVSVNGTISGIGAVSEAPFNIILFQGYEEDGDCAGALIAAPIVIPIEYEDYVSSPPTGKAPEDVTIECGEDIPEVDISSVTELADNSGETPIVAFVEDVSDNGSPEVISRTYSITDDCDNVVYVTQEITVMPEPLPTAICQNISIFLDATGNATITASQINNGSSSCSGEVTITASPLTFDCSNIGDNTVTLTVTNQNGDSATCDATVTVSDNINPNAICQNATIQLDSDGNATLDPSLVDGGSTDNCGIQSIEVDKTVFTCVDIGTNTVTLTVTDDNNNISTCSATVTVEDNIAPTVICTDITVELNSSGNATISAEDVNNGSYDTCSTVTLDVSKTDFDCSNLGENTVTLTATDVYGNEASCDAIVTIEDNTAPTISCQDITVTLDASGNATILPIDIDGGSSDCSGNVNFSASQTEFDCSNIGENVVTLTVTDSTGNESSCDAIVTVEDIIAPTVICQDISVQLDDNGNAIITAEQIDNGSSDACGIQSLSIDTTNFTCENIGENTVELTAIDNNNNSSTCSAIVTVEDNTAPTVICKSITIELNANGTATILPEDLDDESTDNCSELTFSASQTIFDCSNIGENTVTLEVTDSSNNTSTCEAVVTVEDNTVPTVLCQDITIELDDDGMASIEASDIDGGSTDGCGSINLTASQTTFDCSNIGDVIVRLTVTDNVGNTNTCDATVTVEDNVVPTITCPQDIVITADPGQCTASNVDLGTTTTDDNCGVESIVNDSLEPYALGETIVTWTVTDTSGNTTTCTQKVTVTDGNLPEVTCPAPMSVFVDEDSCSASNVELGTLDIEDCTSVDVVNDAPETYPIGDTEVTWTVTDSEGNETSCVQIITVIDNINPTFVETLPIDSLTIECNDVPAAETLTATDNCGDATVSFTEVIIDGSCVNNYTIERTWTATDNYDLTTTFTQTITVQDTTAPTFTGELPDANLVVECDSIPNPETLTAEDSCGDTTVTSEDTITYGDCPSSYTITRVWTAEDECENKTFYTQIITVQDTTAPVFDSPLPDENIEVECDAIPDADSLSATDNCGSVDIELTETRTDGDCPSNYSITRTWVATDECGLQSTFTQTITVIDTTAPIPTSTFETLLDVSCTDIPEAPLVEFTDNCSDNVTVEFSEINTFDETVLEDYQIIRSWEVSDLCNNTETYTQTLNVALDEIYTNIVAPDWCYKEGIVDLNEFIDDSLNTNGTWEMLEGDSQATLTNNIFDPSVLVLSADFLPNDGGIDYLFRYTTTNEGCLSTTEVTMNIHADCDVLPCGETDISISTAITPNGDGINDTFDIAGIDLCGFVANVKIFNRWGALVYESNNYTLGSMSTTGSQGDWNGYSPKSSLGNNGNLPNGTYYYIIQLEDSGLQPLTGPIYLGTK
jgi:gliding motility-associated-like protein